MSLLAWLSVAGVCALGAMSPGPSLAVVLHHAMRGSRRAGVTCAATHAVGVGVYAFATSFGLTALLAQQPGLYRLVSLAGSAYLLWLGVRLIRSRPDPGGTEATAAASAGGAAARDGFLTALLNPKVALFFLAVFSQFTGPDPDTATVLGLTGTAIAIDGAWYSFVAVTVSATRFEGFSRQWALGLDRVTGTVLLLLAAWVLFETGYPGRF